MPAEPLDYLVFTDRPPFNIYLGNDLEASFRCVTTESQIVIWLASKVCRIQKELFVVISGELLALYNLWPKERLSRTRKIVAMDTPNFHQCILFNRWGRFHIRRIS